jgi:hypothetical protein
MYAINEYPGEGDRPVVRWVDVARTKEEMEERMGTR